MSEEHCTFVLEPGSKYIGHASPQSGDAFTLAECIYQYFLNPDNGNSKLSELTVIGCDGTPVNTGKQGLILINTYF